MKITLIRLFSLAAVSMLSTVALANGDHCHSMMHKNMSAEQWQQFKQSHAWMFSDDGKASLNKSDTERDNSSNNKADEQAPAKTTGTDLIGV